MVMNSAKTVGQKVGGGSRIGVPRGPKKWGLGPSGPIGGVYAYAYLCVANCGNTTPPAVPTLPWSVPALPWSVPAGPWSVLSEQCSDTAVAAVRCSWCRLPVSLPCSAGVCVFRLSSITRQVSPLRAVADPSNSFLPVADSKLSSGIVCSRRVVRRGPALTSVLAVRSARGVSWYVVCWRCQRALPVPVVASMLPRPGRDWSTAGRGVRGSSLMT